MDYFGAIDQGTTSTRFIVYDEEHKQVTQHQIEIKQYLNQPGYVEHNPEEIWKSVVDCVNWVSKSFDISLLSSIGITNQRETTLAWRKSTGEHLHNAIVWQDTRTQNICDEIQTFTELKDEFDRTGLPIATYFSLSKIIWLIRNVDEVKHALSEDDLCFGTIDSWLLFKLTGKHQTDITNASRTLLYDLHNLEWNKLILEQFDIPEHTLPTIKPSLSTFAKESSLFGTVPITAVLGDQQASLFGHKGFNQGSVKNTYGTGCFMLCNTGDKLVVSNNGLLTTVAYQIENQSPVFALEGSVAFAGASVQWLRDNLGLIKKSSDVEKLALEVKDNGDVYFVPAFSGLFSPHWDSTARGTVVGLSRYSNKSHIARAVLESVAYQTDELLRSLELDVGEKENKLLVDGGMVDNNLLMQFQSDISSLQIQASNIKEVTAFGAGLASYVYIKKTELKDIPSTKSSQNWNTNMSIESRNMYISKWNKAIEKARNWI